MNTDQADAYVAGQFDQLRTAVAHGDPDAAARIVDQVDADGYPEAAAAMDAGLANTSLGPQLAEEGTTINDVLADAVHTAVQQLIGLSRWVDESPANRERDPEALDWIRNAKVAEEAGEVIDAMNRATGANPRKPADTGMGPVNRELLDVALTALAAFEHNTGHQGLSLASLFTHIRAVHTRAGLTGEPR